MEPLLLKLARQPFVLFVMENLDLLTFTAMWGFQTLGVLHA